MSKIKKVMVAMVMAMVVLFGGIFSLFGVNNVKARALVDSAYGREHLVYYFCDLYPTFSNTVLSSTICSDFIVYDIQEVDENDFNDMVEDEYFVGLGMNSMFILDLKTFAPDTFVLCNLFCQIKLEYGCKTVLITDNVSSLGVVFSELEDCVDAFYSSTCCLQAFAREIVAYQISGGVGNGLLDGTTFLLDNILDDPTEYSGGGIDGLWGINSFLDYFLTELLLYADPYVGDGEVFSTGFRLLHRTSNGSFIDMVTGRSNIALPVEENGIVKFDPTETNDYAVVGFSNIDMDFWTVIKSFQTLAESRGDIPHLLMPVHIFEVEPINYGEDGISAYIFSGVIDGDAEEFLAELGNLYSS